MNPVNSYLDQYVMTADPVELIRMLYQRAIALVQDARRFLAGGEVISRSNAILKAYDILLELTGSLLDEMAPELCGQLRSLYLYMQQRLLDANMKQEEAPLAEVLQLLTTLNEAWVGVSRSKVSCGPKSSEEQALPVNQHQYTIPADAGIRTAAQAYAA